MNQYQRQLTRWLSEAGVQWAEEFPVGFYSVDIYLPELKRAVEVDGPHHGLQRKYDERRTESLRSVGMEVVRVEVGWPKERALRAMLQEVGA